MESEPPAAEDDPAANRRRNAAWRRAAAMAIGAVSVLALPALADGAPPAGQSSGSLLPQLAGVLLLILLNGVFAMAEASLLCVRRSRIDQLVEEGDRRAAIIARLLSDPTRMLSTLQVGVTLIALFSAGAAAESAVEPLAAFLRGHAAGTVLATSSHAVAFFAVLLSVSLLTLVVGEIAPKSIAVRNAETLSLAFARPIQSFQTLVVPLVSVITRLSNLLVRPFGVTASFHSAAFSEDELKIMVEQSEEYGVIEPEQKEMIHSIFDLGETRVSTVMTPRLDISGVAADVTLDDLVRKVTESGHSRLPVYDGDLDHIVGIVHAKDVLNAISAAANVATVRSLARPATFIPESKRIDLLLAEFRKYKRQMAIVLDEYGTVTGVVTVEDILEEIVGEIQDEYDTEDAPIRQIDANTSSIDGRMSITDFNDRMGIELPEEDADTIGGFVFGLLGRQPVQGDVAVWDGLEFRIEVTDGRRINRVCVRHAPHDAEPKASADTERRGEPNGS